MDLTEIAVTAIGGVVAIVIAWLPLRAAARHLRGRRGGRTEPEQEAAAVLNPQRDYIAFLRQQLDERDDQLEECSRERRKAELRAVRLEERLRQQEGTG